MGRQGGKTVTSFQSQGAQDESDHSKKPVPSTVMVSAQYTHHYHSSESARLPDFYHMQKECCCSSVQQTQEPFLPLHPTISVFYLV